MDKGAIEEIKRGQVPAFQSVMEDPVTGAPVAALPPGWTLASLKPTLDAYRAKPERVKGVIRADNVDSFINITNRFKGENSALYFQGEATETSVEASLLSVLNYHPQGGDDTKAEWCDHRVQHSFETSPELERWMEANKQGMSQADFAAFIENNAADMVVNFGTSNIRASFGSVSPTFATPTDMVMLSRGIEIRANEKYHAAYRAENGTMNMQFTSTHDDGAGQPLNIPQWFALGVRVFIDGDTYLIPVRLRYRVKDGAVTWFYELYRMQDIFEAALKDAVAKTSSATELPLYRGAPV